MRLTDSYYDLVLERDQLLEELEYIEKEIEKMENQKPRFMLVKEIVDKEHDECIFYTHEEFYNYTDAKIIFDEYVRDVKSAIEGVIEAVEHEGIFHISNNEESINLIIYDLGEE